MKFLVHDSEGNFFRSVHESEAEMLLERRAVQVHGRRKKLLILSVHPSMARALLAPKPLPSSSKTFLVERVGDRRMPIYQHNHPKCETFKK